MSQCFSIPTVLRMIPKPLLQRFFAKLGLRRLPIKWRCLKPCEVHPILRAIAQISTDAQMTLENTLHQIVDIACDNGATALRETGGECFVQPTADDHLCLAMRAWIEHPEVFERAAVLQQPNRFEQWRRRAGLPRIAPKTSHNAFSRLGTTLSDLLKHEQGHSRRCSVEYMREADGTDCFLAYPDGVWQTTLVHDENGNLVSRSTRSALEIAFAYDRNEGVLETYADVSPPLKRELENAFCSIVLGEKLTTPVQCPAYDLNILKRGPLSLTTEPEDGVAVGIRRMRLTVLNSQRNIILVADRNGAADDIYAMLHECLNSEHLPLSVLNVMAVQFNFEFRAVNGRRSDGIVFDVTHPDLSTLRNQRPDLAAIARKHLRKWRIAVG